MSRYYHALIIAMLTLVLGCSEAKTLGDEKPDEVLLPENPTWVDGVGILMQNKCATCHHIPLQIDVPDTTPGDLDLHYYESENGLRGALSIVNFIQAGILTEDIFADTPQATRKMPLDFATPLTQREIDGLLRWVELGAPLTAADIVAKDEGDTAVDTSNDTSTDTSDDIAKDTEEDEHARGKELFHQLSSARSLSCASCHGTNGDLTGHTPESPAIFGTDLTNSNLSGDALNLKVQSMWDSEFLTGFGDGAFAALPSDDQDALINYLLSLRE